MDHNNRLNPKSPKGHSAPSGAFESLADIERFYQQVSALLDKGPMGIAGIDTGETVRYWSKSCEEILGYPASEVIGKLRLSDLSSETCQPFAAGFKDFSTDKHSMEEGVFVHKDGSPRILHQIVIPIFLRRNRHAGFTVCLLDVTKKRHAEEALRRERNMLNLVLDAMGAGVALFDSTERLQWANNTLAHWFGFDNDKSRGMHCREVYQCVSRKCDECALRLVRNTHKPQSSEMAGDDADGHWHYYLHSATPLDIGREQYLVLTLDVTEERRRKEHLLILNELARALTRSLQPDKVQHLVLTCITAGHALGFNRAFLFLLDDGNKVIRGSMAVGPRSGEEAERIWQDLSQNINSLEELLDRSELAESDKILTEQVRNCNVSVASESSILAKAVRDRQTLVINDNSGEIRADRTLKDQFDLMECIVVPLIARGKAIGAILADNRYSGNPINESQMQLLKDFAAQASLAIGNATAHHQLQVRMRQLQQTQDRLVEAERLASVGRMSAHLAHEIRNPLSTVGGFAKSIERNCDKPDIVRRNAAIIYDESLRLEGVLNDVLDFSRPVKLENQTTQLNDLMESIAKEYAAEMKKKSIRLKIDLDKNLPELFADPHQLKQVIINLIQNAFEALENSRKKQLLMGTSQTKDEIIASISDSGQGIDEKNLKNIFAPFFSSKKGGSGLGLAISRKIIRQHGGDISVESMLGKGTTFDLRLPKQM